MVDAKVIPAAHHKAISKSARKTHHIERCNNTLRQRVSRLVRDALSFSTQLANPIGAMELFICHSNLTRATAGSKHYMNITIPLEACEEEPMAMGCVESTVNEVVSRRLCKKQHRQWSKEGAHLL
jgi:hypothetical protein